ncbi:Beta-galactosidase [Seminavis robusta]|uniref:Beta-galactosidase n=1 Tax=Seminavis robusta TaxID=568900 RepID=A0A9N8I0M0_9STRA|nr:Beta-galactosidase [Seminavis robusta]|eukprot:Sro2771_g336750.1 Beta-galactosidase (833) ;mRNA; r:1769-4574
MMALTKLFTILTFTNMHLCHSINVWFGCLWIVAILLGLSESHGRILDTDDASNDSGTTPVAYNRRSFIIHGKPTLLLSGSIHYTRIPPSDWNNVFQMAKELGLNCIQTLVIWSEHEPEPNKFNWEGYGDLVKFIDLAAAHDLYVVVRIGPYICGEYYFGGIPLWMRHVTDDEDGREIGCFRCSDALWEREMKRWVSIVVNKLRPQLASNGGPIIWMQVENEYDPDDAYLEWAVDMARNVTTEIPWSLCGHNINECNKLNGHGKDSTTINNNGQTNKVVCTVNGFWSEAGVGVSQPGPVFFDKLWSGNPTQPAAWTEDQGWFDIWGYGRRVRWTSDVLYGIARFLAYGGSYHNFYMLSGGNNYGLRAGRDATTAYAADTAIDNLLLRHEPRFSSLQALFAVIRSIEKELLQQSVPVKPVPLKRTHGSRNNNSTAETHEYGKIAFLSNYGETALESGTFDYKGHSYSIPNHTVVLLDTSSHKVLFNTSASSVVDKDQNLLRQEGPEETALEPIPLTNWVSFQEQVAYGAIRRSQEESPEQLNITKNKSDYLWYSFQTEHAGKISVEAIGYGGYQYVYVNGRLSDTVTTAGVVGAEGNTSSLSERQLLRVHKNGHKKRKVDIFSVAMGLANQKKRVDILSVAMGMSTSVSPQTGKGIKSVSVGKGNPPYTTFATAWKLKGEELEIYTEKGASRVPWEPMSSSILKPTDGLMWLKGSFEVPKSLLPFVGGAQPNQTALVVNLQGLNKGMAYVNGFHLGRYWLVKGECDGGCAPPKHGHHCFLHWAGCGRPTQHLYHIPFEVLKASGNTLTLFEETESQKKRNLDQVHIKVAHNHIP